MRPRTIGIHKPLPVPSHFARLMAWLLLKAGAGIDAWQRSSGWSASGGPGRLGTERARRDHRRLPVGPGTPSQDDVSTLPGSLFDDRLATDAAALGRLGEAQFEGVARALFEQPGLTTSCPARRGAPGLDIWLYRPHGDRLPVSLVQCRHWPGKRVGADRVRALWAVMAVRHVPRGQLVTSASFTEEAVAFALDHHIELIDGAALIELVQAHPQAARLAGL